MNSQKFNMNLDFNGFPRQISTISSPVGTPSRFQHGIDMPTKSGKVETPTSQYFRDGRRLIDYVLVYEEDNADDDDEDIEVDLEPKEKSGSTTLLRFGVKKTSRREIFEKNLEKLGLELEYAHGKYTNTKFLLIHAPFKVLCRQAERLRIRMPICQNDIKKNTTLSRGGYGWFNRFIKFKFLDFDDKVRKRTEMQGYFTQPFVAEHLECFVNHEDEENFFPRTERSRMVYDLLIRTRYERRQSTQVHFGIQRLLYNRVYLAAFPLHEELLYPSKDPVDLETCSDRQFLYETWVKMKNWYKYQPLHLIQKYFGTQIGFYFAWLGYYTRFSYLISFIGILCTLYGVSTMFSDVYSNEICQNTTTIMCPICDHYCDFTFLNSSCIYSKISYVFDNNATVFFAVLMCIWVTIFLEGWKRYQAEIAYKWNVFDLEPEEVMRPEFQFYARRTRMNPVTQQSELFMPLKDKLLRLTVSGSTVLLLCLLIVALTIGMVVYRVIVLTVFREHDDDEKTYQSNAIIFSAVTAAIINLVFILIMNYLYYLLSLKLTEWECPKSQTDFDNSYTVKVFLFQFVNYYSSLFYIAFFKGRVSIFIRGKRLDQCDPAGCMVELVIQLFVIMVGQQFLNAIVEIGYNVVYWIIRRWQLKQLHLLPEVRVTEIYHHRFKRIRREVINREPQVPQYEKDYAMNAAYDQFLCDEYLEMVMQFGFVTLFVSVFPLAPLFALINNIFEMRLDAYKLLVTMQRPMPAQTKDIGIWMTILEIMSFLAVLCNACLIAFTSDFIPKLYYRFKTGSLIGYVDFSLSYDDARGMYFYRNEHMRGVEICRYRANRMPPCSLLDIIGFSKAECSDDYAQTYDFWVILTCRVIFVLLFLLVVLTIKTMFTYCIKDIPTKIDIQLKREKYLARQAILQRQESLIAERKTTIINSETQTKRIDEKIVHKVKVGPSPPKIFTPECKPDGNECISCL